MDSYVKWTYSNSRIPWLIAAHKKGDVGARLEFSLTLLFLGSRSRWYDNEGVIIFGLPPGWLYLIKMDFRLWMLRADAYFVVFSLDL